MRKGKKRHAAFSVSLPAVLAFAFWALAEGSAAAIVPITAALLHEAGHLLAMSLCGVPVDRINICVAGAEIRGRHTGAGKTAMTAVYLAGPLVNLIFGAASAAAGWDIFALCSFALAAVNLLPVRTLDGGNALSVLLSDFSWGERFVSVMSAVSVFLLWLVSVCLLFLSDGNLSLLAFVVCVFTELYLA